MCKVSLPGKRKAVPERDEDFPNFTHGLNSQSMDAKAYEAALILDLPPFPTHSKKITRPPLLQKPCPGDVRARSAWPASKWQRGNAALSSSSEVKPQSLCPFPRDGWRSRPVAMIMRLEFYCAKHLIGKHMVSIWMLCTSRTPGSERHKALPAGLRPRAPQGPPARPQRQTLSAARPRAPAKPAGEPAAGEPELQGETPAARRVDRSLRLTKKSTSQAKP